MFFQQKISLKLSLVLSVTALGAAVTAACSSSKSSPPASTTAATCASAGEPTPGPPDTHCQLPDGGTTIQSTSQASCMVSSGDDGGADESCAYGATQYGQESDDDDCKYHVTWTSTPICEQGTGAAPAPVIFTVTATHKGDGTPLMGAATQAEVFTSTPGDWDAATYCDTMSMHENPNNVFNQPMNESTPGTYTGPIYFDQPGQWTVRFHFFEVCFDVVDDSPHGHAAFHITVP